MKKIQTKVLAVLVCVLLLATAILSVSAAKYTDAKSGDWYYDFVSYMSDKGIINGYTDNTFRPNNYVKRCEFIKMMVVTFGLDAETTINFNDVDEDDWYYEYYSKAAAQGFLGEIFSGNNMYPEEYLTREEAAGLLMAYLDYPEDAKSPSSTFADYTTIASKYRDYVLQAAYAEIINGFEDGDVFNFRPAETLRRAQAAKILSVAAGTIADSNLSTALDFDGSDNLTVTDNVTIANIKVPGNVIISEGITSGTVTFVGCTIDGTVYNRSSANVVFSDCDINVLNIDTSSANVQIKQSTTVDTLNVNFLNADIDFATTSYADKVLVESGATGVKITDSNNNSIINALTVKANNLSCEIEPLKLDLSSGISATINDVLYKDGVKGNIYTEWSSGSEYLNFKTYKNGTLKYYYSSSATVPTKAQFPSQYTNASVKGSFDAIADKAYRELTNGTSADIESYPYLMVALYDGSTVVSNPISINRESARYGFTVAPTVTVSGTNDSIRLTPKSAGTLYYYYTFEATAPASYATAKEIYDATDASIKGTLTYSSATASNQITKSVEAVEKYTNIVVFYVDNSGNKYYPVILERPYMTNGLAAEPYVIAPEEADEYDVLTITAASSGTLQWFYTDSTVNFTSAAFTDEYTILGKDGPRGSATLTANKSTNVNLLVRSEGEQYSYVIIRLGNNLPIRLQRRTSVTGFDVTPTVLTTSNKDLLSFDTIGDGMLQYLYVDANRTYTTESFANAYEAAEDDLRGTLQANGATQDTTSNKKSADIKQKYVAFMYTSASGQAHNPVTVERKTIGTGFIGTPRVEYDYDKQETTLYINASARYEIKYFVLQETELNEDLVDKFDDLHGTSGLKTISKSDISIGEKAYTLDITVTNPEDEPKYIAILADYGNHINFTPVLIEVKRIDDGIKKDTNLRLEYDGDYDKITIVINENAVDGIFEYYYTNTKPDTTAKFNSIFSASATGTISLNKAQSDANSGTFEFNAGRSKNLINYDYIVYRIKDKTGKYLTPGYHSIGEAHGARATITRDNNSNSIKIQVKDSEVYTAYWIYSINKIDIKSTNFKNKWDITAVKLRGSQADIKKPNDPQNPSLDYVIIDSTIPNDNVVYKYVYIALKDIDGNFYRVVEKELLVPTT